MLQLIQMVWQDKKDVLLALLAGTVSGLTAVALFAQSGLLISKAALMPPFYIILILTAFLKLFGVTKSASKYAERLLSHRVTFRLISVVRNNFFQKLLPQAHVLNSYKSGDLLTRITSDVEQLQNFFLRVLYPPFVAILVFFVTILFTLFFSPWIALLLMIGLICTSVIVPYILYKKSYVTATQERKQLTIDTTEYLYGYRELLLHNEIAHKNEQLEKLFVTYATARKKELNEEQNGYVWNQAIALLTSFAVIFVSVYLTTIGDLQGVYLALITLVSLTVFESAVPLSMVPIFARHTKKALEQLDEVTSTSVHEGDKEVEHLCAPISLQNVSYYYPNSSRAALHNISLSIAPGEKIAIVGPSGSGKTTLLQLLMNEISPTSGDINIGDVRLKDINRASLYSRLATMLQHNHFFSGTIKSNLLLAKSNATDTELLAALDKASLNKDLDDIVYEKGGNLSGGEKQRLAFARLLLKSSDVWLIDEPFTSLDVQTEQQLFKTLFKEAANKTVVMITHNLNDLHNFDRIYVMQDGKFAEVGSEEQLLNNNGLFYAMKKDVTQ